MTTLDHDNTTDVESLQDIDTETTCAICNAEFLDPNDLEVHVTQVHAVDISKSKQCHFCTTLYSDLEAYALHLRDVHFESFKSCQYCTKVFTDIDKYRVHERRHYSAKKNHKKCSQCAVAFDKISQLEQHEYENHNNNTLNCDVAYACGACDYGTLDISDYVQHLQKKDCRSLVCDCCSNIYKNKKGLLKHIRYHKECNRTAKGSKKCPECNKDINVLFYQNHVKHCKPIKCVACNIIFNTMYELSEHHSSEHPLSVEVILCKFCSRQCVGKASLQKHIARVHQSEFHLYKYKCIECNMAFKHPQKLFAHYFLKHKDLEPYTCKICDKKFRIRKRFTIHIKLDHKSVGFVEFDENYHVFFTEKKSDNPFIPTCVIPDEDFIRQDEKLNEPESPKISVRNLESMQKLNIDDLNQTETEVNLTDAEKKHKESTMKRKKKIKVTGNAAKRFKKNVTDVISVDSSEEDEDDQPLLSLKKRKPKISVKKRFPISFSKKTTFSKNNRKQLTCNQCQKYCYTYQNYQHHMSLHIKTVSKTCIKCSKVFKSKEKLSKHIKTEHSSSKLTETLKSLLEKRKKGIVDTAPESSVSEKFKNTIKKAKMDNTTAIATLTPVENGLSVQKFIESFTPESNEATKNNTKNIMIDSSVSIKMVNSPFYRKPVIKFIKFDPKPPVENAKLSLPVKFKPDTEEKVKISMKLVQEPLSNSNFFLSSYETNMECNEDNTYSDHYEESDQYKSDAIPEVAQEVMLEGSDETPKPIPVSHKIVLPNLPKGCPEVSIAHLMPEAPYFKIVKVNEVIKGETKKKVDKELQMQKKDMINLPDGTKLVTVNPLAHLLGDKDVDTIMEPLKNKYYKAKHSNVENLLTRALAKASTPTKIRKKKSVNQTVPETATEQ